MEKITTLLFFLLILSSSLYASNRNRILEENDLDIIEITEITLENIDYYQESFATPTKLVFTNLTSVSGHISFYENTNLVEVEFPLLETVGAGGMDYEGTLSFYNNDNLTNISMPLLESIGAYTMMGVGEVSFYSNDSLETIYLPALTTIYDKLSVTANTALNQLEICSLTEILQSETAVEIPSYHISGNNATIDDVAPCFSQGAPENLTLSNNTVSENQPENTVVGALSATGTGTLIYYFDEMADNEEGLMDLDNDKFTFEGSQLVTTQIFDYETDNEYTINVHVRNQLGENTSSQFTINVLDVVTEDMVIVEITDTTLENIDYSQESFTTPTKLVFTNLTSVSGRINFYENTNLVEVEFPLLETVGAGGIDYEGTLSFYNNNNLTSISMPLLESVGAYTMMGVGEVSFYSNDNLEIINLPVLTTIYDKLSVTSNTALSQLEICSLTEILQSETAVEIPSYHISGNNATIDDVAPCFSQGTPENLNLSNLTVSENQPTNTVVGTLSATGTGTLTYYFDEIADIEEQTDPDNIIVYDNNRFIINENQLETAQPFDFEATEQFVISVHVRNGVGEKTANQFTISVTDIASETIEIVEITDTTLDHIDYYKDSFTTPTKLVYPNLTAVTNYISFYENTNIIAVEFPLLETVGIGSSDLPSSRVSFYRNESLQTVNAPNLNTIYNELFVSENTLLESFNVCNLTDILDGIGDELMPPYYYIQNNPLLDFSTTCLLNTSVTYTPEDTITILPPPNTLAGTFSSDATSGTMRYFFVDENGAETEDPKFVIIDDGLYLKNEYDTYTDFSFDLEVNAFRINTTGRTSNSNLNQKISLKITADISNTTLESEEFLDNSTELHLYPNPTTSCFTIQSIDKIQKVEIFNIRGRKIAKFESNAENKFNISTITHGMYIIKTYTDKKQEIRKLIKL